MLASLPLLWWRIGALGRRCRPPGGGARAGRPALRCPGGGARCPAPRLLDADPQAVDLPGSGGEVTLQLQLPLPQSAIQGMSIVQEGQDHKIFLSVVCSTQTKNAEKKSTLF